MTETNCEFQPDKPREYRLFLVWLNMSRPMKELGIPYLDQEGIYNPEIRELAGIKNLTELSNYLHVAPNTLTDWKRRPVPEEYADISWRNWLAELRPMIVSHVQQGLAKRKDPASAKFLLELDGSYTPKQEVQISGSQELFDNVKKLLDHVKENN